jgi:hypothetical protein
LGDILRPDELFVTIRGKRQYLWRAVDQDGNVIDILLQLRRNQHEAGHFGEKISAFRFRAFGGAGVPGNEQVPVLGVRCYHVEPENGSPHVPQDDRAVFGSSGYMRNEAFFNDELFVFYPVFELSPKIVDIVGIGA